MDKSFETSSNSVDGREINGVKSFLLDIRNKLKEKSTEVRLRLIPFTNFTFLEEEVEGVVVCSGVEFLDYMKGTRYKPQNAKEFFCCMYGLNESCKNSIMRHGDYFREKIISQAQHNGWNMADTQIALDLALSKIEKTNKNNQSNRESFNSEEEKE